MKLRRGSFEGTISGHAEEKSTFQGDKRSSPKGKKKKDTVVVADQGVK